MKQGLLILIGIFSLVGAIVFAIIRFSELKEKEIENEAKFQCAQSSRYSITEEDGAAVWYPVQDLYKKCLEEKNIR